MKCSRFVEVDRQNSRETFYFYFLFPFSFTNTLYHLPRRVVEGSWLVKKGVGTTPAILGNKLDQNYHFDSVWKLNSSLYTSEIILILTRTYLCIASTNINFMASCYMVATQERNIFTIEVDVGSSSVAGSILGMVKGAAKSLIIDLLFLLEGQVKHLILQQVVL